MARLKSVRSHRANKLGRVVRAKARHEPFRWDCLRVNPTDETPGHKGIRFAQLAVEFNNCSLSKRLIGSSKSLIGSNYQEEFMAYDEEQARRSRVVVETPNSRREVTHTEAVRGDRDGISGATVGVIVVVAIALITIVVLFLMNGPTETTNANLTEQPPAQQPVIVQQPAQQQPPVIIQQPAPVGAAPPIIINQPAPSSGTSSSDSQDGSIQAEIDKRISEDSTLSTLGITATVLDGKVTLTGTVKSEGLKSQVDRMIRAIRGVKQVDNQIVAMG